METEQGLLRPLVAAKGLPLGADLLSTFCVPWNFCPCILFSLESEVISPSSGAGMLVSPQPWFSGSLCLEQHRAQGMGGPTTRPPSPVAMGTVCQHSRLSWEAVRPPLPISGQPLCTPGLGQLCLRWG